MTNFECEKCGKLYMNLKTPREIELEKENGILKQKLKIAEEALKYYAGSKMPDNLYTSEKINGSAISTDIWAIRGEFNQCKYKVYYDNESAQEALQKISEVK